ncbi:MAG: glycosyltransferase family 4 protein [Caldilineaceae bacterium]
MRSPATTGVYYVCCLIFNMRILFLTQVLPYPLDAGPKLRAYYVLQHLAQQHEITLVSFVRPTDTAASVAHLRGFCQAVHIVPMPRSRLRDGVHLLRSLIANRAFIIERDWTAAMTRLLTSVVEQAGPFDAIHADQLWMAPYACWLKQKLLPTAQTVLDQHNAVFMIPQRLAASEANPFKRKLLQLEAHKLARFEVQTCAQFDHVTWVTHDDFAVLQQQADRHNVALPNAGVIPICGDAADKPMMRRGQGARRITFLGGLHYPPNAQGVCWFAEHVFSHILAQAPAVCLTVIGKQPPPQLQKLGIPPQNLEVTGFVDDPTSYLAETAVFVVPLLAGGGMRVKILDAWMWGLPVVSTRVGAEGIELCDGQNIELADEPHAFAQAVLNLLANPQRAAQMGAAGRQWALERYDWRTVYKQWDAIYI